MEEEDFDFSLYYCWQVFSKWPEEVGGGREPSFWVQGFGRLCLVWTSLLRFKVLQRGCGHDLKLGEWKYQTPKMVLLHCVLYYTCMFFHIRSYLENMKLYLCGHWVIVTAVGKKSKWLSSSLLYLHDAVSWGAVSHIHLFSNKFIIFMITLFM